MTRTNGLLASLLASLALLGATLSMSIAATPAQAVPCNGECTFDDDEGLVTEV